MDQPGQVANPARGQLNRGNEYSMPMPYGTVRPPSPPHPSLRPTPPVIVTQSIANERASRLIDRDLMKTSLSMLSGLGVDGVAVYEEDFENEFLATTRAFYRAESQVLLLLLLLLLLLILLLLLLSLLLLLLILYYYYCYCYY